MDLFTVWVQIRESSILCVHHLHSRVTILEGLEQKPGNMHVQQSLPWAPVNWLGDKPFLLAPGLLGMGNCLCSQHDISCRELGLTGLFFNPNFEEVQLH
jgi:hypothetical protein